VRLHISRTTTLRHAGAPRQVATQWFERRTLKNHRNWISVSEYTRSLTANAFPDLRADRERVIYSPIVVPELHLAAPPPVPSPYVLFAGSVWSRKGALVVGEAARIFLREFPDLHMVFAGRVDPSEKADERIVETLGRDL